MPITETVVAEVSCDNPACPGNNLDPSNTSGWTLVKTEIIDQGPLDQFVYCCFDCAGSVGDALTARAG